MNNWVALVRVNPKAGWCAYGPMSHVQALDFRRRFVGTAIECQLANLIHRTDQPAPQEERQK